MKYLESVKDHFLSKMENWHINLQWQEPYAHVQIHNKPTHSLIKTPYLAIIASYAVDNLKHTLDIKLRITYLWINDQEVVSYSSGCSRIILHEPT